MVAGEVIERLLLNSVLIADLLLAGLGDARLQEWGDVTSYVKSVNGGRTTSSRSADLGRSMVVRQSTTPPPTLIY